MAFKVGVLEADQPASDLPVRKIKRAIADTLVEKSLARRISKFLIQMIKMKSYEVLETLKTLWDGPLGVGNALPFARQSDGTPLHYAIPHAGDIGLWRHFKKKIRVSARPQSHLAAPFIRRTQPQALVVVSPNVLSLGAR